MEPAGIDTELALAGAGARVIAGVDEVGRGAWAGPVTVALCAVPAERLAEHPVLWDSKVLSARRRAALVEEACAWGSVHLGSASAAEIDALGMAAALRMAARRAWEATVAAGITVDALIQDGSASFIADDIAAQLTQLVVQPKADATCATVAAASVVAKEHRDAHMRELAARYPQWPAFATSAGYGTRAHSEQIRAHGLSDEHRASWSFAQRLGAAPPPRMCGSGT